MELTQSQLLKQYITNCDSCAQYPNCKIDPELFKISNMEQFKDMNCKIQVHCKMFRNKGAVLTGCTSCYPPSPEPKVVTNCKEQCDFYDYCLKPIYVNDITALQIEAVKWQLPVTLTAMCDCLIKKENEDGNS